MATRQGIKGLLEGEEEDERGEKESPRGENANESAVKSPGRVPAASGSGSAAVPISIPVREGSMTSKVWAPLQKGGSLLGDPEERMMAEGQDGNTPGSGLVRVRCRASYSWRVVPLFGHSTQGVSYRTWHLS